MDYMLRIPAKNEVIPDTLLDLRLDGIHHARPSYRIGCLQIFIDTRRCCHLRDHLIQQSLCFCIHFVQIVLQFTAAEQSAIQSRAMHFQILHPRSAVITERLGCFDFNIGEIVIPDEGIVRSVCAVVDSGRECVHGVSPLSCGLGRNVTLQRVADCTVSSPSMILLITPQYSREKEEIRTHPRLG